MVSGIADIGIIILFSLVGSAIAIKYRFPPVIGLLVIGALIGPNALGIVTNDSAISLFSEIGSVLLLFTIGIEFSLSKIFKFSLRAVLVGFFKMGLGFLIGYLLSLFIGLALRDSLILGLLISFSSTSIMMNIINQPGFRGREINGFLTAEQIVEDAASVLVLAFIAGMQNSEINSASSGLLGMFVPVAFSFAVAGIAYVVLEKVVRWFLGCLECYDNNDAMILASLSVAAVFVFLADWLGLPLSTGAFLAGSLVSSVDGFRKVEQSIIQFNTVFAAFFFFSIGMAFKLDMSSAFIFTLLAVSLINVLAKFASGSVSSYIFGFDSRNSIYAGLAFIPIGEFSLIIARELVPYSSIDLISILSSAVVLSAIISSKMVYREEGVEKAMLSFIPKGALGLMKSVSSYLDSVISYFEPGGQGFSDFLAHSKELASHAALAMLVAGGAVVVSLIIDIRNITSFDVLLSRSVLGAGLLLSLVPLFLALRDAKNMISVLAKGFVVDMGEGAKLDRRAERDFAAFLLLFALSALMPLFFGLISLPRLFNDLAIVPFLISLLFLYDAAVTASRVLKLRAKPHAKFRHGFAGIREKIGERLSRRR
ncbi:MAG: cation:proton antiporter [Candidatus Micrarchaeia archaeon]